MTDGVKILEVRELIPPVKRKPQLGKPHGKQQNKQFNKKKGHITSLMGSFIVQGGKSLKGEIIPQGAKNEALQVICATLLTPEKVTISNIPDINDVNKLIELIGCMGVKISKNS